MIDDIKYSYTVEPEDELPSDHFEDAENVKWVCDQIEKGNEYAWFCAKVTATIGSFSASTYLGCCSYESKEAWENEDDYYGDMKKEACSMLIGKLKTAKAELDRLVESNPELLFNLPAI